MYACLSLWHISGSASARFCLNLIIYVFIFWIKRYPVKLQMTIVNYGLCQTYCTGKNIHNKHFKYMGFSNMGWLRQNLTEAEPQKFPLSIMSTRVSVCLSVDLSVKSQKSSYIVFSSLYMDFRSMKSNVIGHLCTWFGFAERIMFISTRATLCRLWKQQQIRIIISPLLYFRSLPSEKQELDSQEQRMDSFVLRDWTSHEFLLVSQLTVTLMVWLYDVFL